jgi:hypothetical protein
METHRSLWALIGISVFTLFACSGSAAAIGGWGLGQIVAIIDIAAGTVVAVACLMGYAILRLAVSEVDDAEDRP